MLPEVNSASLFKKKNHEIWKEKPGGKQNNIRNERKGKWGGFCPDTFYALYTSQTAENGTLRI